MKDLNVRFLLRLWISGANLVALVCALLVPLSVNALDVQPTRIGQHDKSLAKLIQFPDLPGEHKLFLRCEANVLPAGTIHEVGCYSDPNVDLEFYRAVSAAAADATMIPATVGGRAVPTNVLFAVMFRAEQDSKVVAVVPNHGSNAQAHGLQYTAPQRYGTK